MTDGVRRFSLTRYATALVFGGGALMGVACAASGDAASPTDGGWEPPSAGSGGSSATGGAFGSVGGASTGGLGQLPEEEEIESAFTAPVSSGKYLWSANPESGRVALIDAETQAIRILSAGLAPTYLTSLPTTDGSPSALVQNVGSSNASWFREVDGTIQETKIPTHPNANRFAVSASGRFVLLWGVADRRTELPPTEGLQDLVVLDLAASPPKSRRVTVGYRPSSVTIADAEDRAAIVSAEGLTLLDLGEEPSVASYVSLGGDAGRDVSVTRDLAHAFVRRSGSNEVEVLALDDPEESFFVEFSGAVTDLDLTESGLGVAVIREEHQAAIFRVEDLVVDATNFETVTIGSELFGSVVLAPAENLAVLYTNAAESSRLVVLRLADRASRVVDTTQPIHTVAVAPDGKHAVVTAGTAEASAQAFSVVALEDPRFPRIVGTKGTVRSAAIVNDAVLAASSDGAAHETVLVGLPSLSLERVPLASPPLAGGILPGAGLGYVAQAHPEGRISFYGLAFSSGEAPSVKTVTGFELSAEVISR